MDEQRIARYAELIQKLLACPNGEEMEILEANVELLDAGLLAVMAMYSQYLRGEGQENNAKWLEEFARHIEPGIRELGRSDNSESWDTLMEQIVQLYQQGQYAAAIPLGERAVELARERWGNEHKNVATSLNNLASLYEHQGRYSEAEPLYQEAIAIVRIALPENHPDLATDLNNLAGLYKSQGRYSDAEPLFQDAIAIDRIALPENHPQLATHLNNLAGLYRSQGRYSEAEPLYEEAIAIVRIALPENHPNIASALNNLAGLYRSQGRYSEAEPLYQDAIAIVRIALPENHPNIASALNNLAGLYRSQGRYSEAEPLFQDAIAIDRIALPENHPQLATHLNNLANLYRSQGRYSEAEPLYQDAIAIDRIALPENHPSIATDLNNLAGLYESQGRYSEAEPLYQDAIAIDRIALPENHPDLATHLNNLANLYRSQGRYSEAEPLFQDAIAIDRIALPENHPSIATDLNNLAGLYESQGRYSEALQQFQASLECEQNRLRYIFSTHSDRERREYLESNRVTYNVFLSLVAKYLADDPEAVGAALDAVLRRKSLTTAALAAQSAAIYGGRYGEPVKALFHQWQHSLEKLRKATYNPTLPSPNLSPEQNQQQRDSYRQQLQDLQTEAEILEKQLAKEVPELQLNQDTINRQLIAEQLPEGSALVEFVRFERWNFDAEKGKEWQEERYLAFAVMAHQPEQVRLIDLGEAESLDRLLDQFRSYFIECGEYLTEFPDYFTSGGDTLGVRRTKESEEQKKQEELQKKKLREQKAKELAKQHLQTQPQIFQVLCQPLIEVLGTTSRWFLAPDSALNLLPFQILPMSSPPTSLSQDNEEMGYLTNTYSISYLSSGRDLLPRQLPQRQLDLRPATILADPDYNWDGKESHPAPGEAKQQDLAEAGLAGTLNTLSGFGRAAGTDTFGRKVGKLLGVQPYLDKEAVSTHLTHSACPRILAVATHGFARTGQKPYAQFVLALIAAESGTETQLFQSNPSFMNSRLLKVVEAVAQYYQDNNPKVTEWLHNFLTPQIQAYLNEHPPSSRLDMEVEDAMYRAGIALAGANIWNQGKKLQREGMKGVMFAQDIAALDLWGNELSALIACQTGLGEVSSGEGVFGLRRAFAIAGSKTLIMSLWSVPALATSYLMERFFAYLDRQMGRAAALAAAQSDVRTVTAGQLRQSELGQQILQEVIQMQNRDYADEDCPLSHPYYWGAWICQGDIGPLDIQVSP
ncbi:CHAT domain-containing tetratricopeptide repeat protein [Roseofilum casamattae]|uniref:Tetratricopeptide repeat protein n=1 Tax=Roseofilum casamattae BLCC-M143 TaxID=3022442 RepID=A0ABT7BVC2_9CYAN|nr:CHAT domain-containing protein [Roseofilum casamattae]MDJ1183148.1 tetratricopeptide repeat protein [Roseofilum casamattae BLCC-M143]